MREIPQGIPRRADRHATARRPARWCCEALRVQRAPGSIRPRCLATPATGAKIGATENAPSGISTYQRCLELVSCEMHEAAESRLSRRELCAAPRAAHRSRCRYRGQAGTRHRDLRRLFAKVAETNLVRRNCRTTTSCQPHAAARHGSHSGTGSILKPFDPAGACANWPQQHHRQGLQYQQDCTTY